MANCTDLINTICERAEHLFRSMSGSDRNVSQLYRDFIVRGDVGAGGQVCEPEGVEKDAWKLGGVDWSDVM
jgi:hypothetical protein